MGIIFILLAGGSGLWFMGNDTRVVTTEIEIAASPEQVWKTVSNIDNWKNWSPIIEDSQGTPSPGAKLMITMVGDEGKNGKPGPSYEPVITVFEPSKNLSWSANMGANFIMTNGKIMKLEATNSGTKLIHKETFRGMMVPMMWEKFQNNVPNMLNSMNEALKKIVEEN